MELNRRNFIKFLVGGVAGIHVTPLPWKLTDDSAIWTQNWPWVPVPPEGAFAAESTVCTLCPGGCGIEVRKVDERTVKIEGRTDYPVNPGGPCPVGMGGLQLLCNEDIRFTRPMKRVGPRGSGDFKDITWDEAMEALRGRLAVLREQGRPEALVAIDGSPRGSTQALLLERLLMSMGSSNYTRIPSAEDTFWMAGILMQGNEGPMAFDLENADFILSFGSGLLEGWGAPGRVLNAWGMWRGEQKGKTRIVQVDSRASNTASKADLWVAVKPGTEAALALGLAHVLVTKNLYDRAFVRNHAFGFEPWESSDGKRRAGFKALLLEKYAPSKVSRMTGVPAAEIERLATDFARARAPLALCGKGKGDLNGSLYETMAVLALNALVGGINRRGGVLVHDKLPLDPFAAVEADAIASAGLRKGRLDGAGSATFPFAQSLVNRLPEVVLKSRSTPVDTVLVLAANPLYTLPGSGAYRRMFEKVPFIVSFSPYRDETAMMADLILPDHVFLEKLQDVVWPSGLQYPLVGLSRPVIEPLYRTRHAGDVLIGLAKGLGEGVADNFPWENFEEALKERFKGIAEGAPGLTSFDGSTPPWQTMASGGDIRADYESLDDLWEKMQSGGLWFRPAHAYGVRNGLFKTPTGRFEFFSTQIELALEEQSQRGGTDEVLARMGVSARGDEACMPHFEEASSGGDPAHYPLILVPYEMINLASGWIPSPPFLFKTIFDNQLLKQDSFVELNPETAAKLNLRQGQRVMVESPAGRIQARVSLFEGAAPGAAYLPLGLGHTAYDEFLKDKGANPNEIIEPARDPLSGLPAWWNTRVRLRRI